MTANNGNTESLRAFVIEDDEPTFEVFEQVLKLLDPSAKIDHARDAESAVLVLERANERGILSPYDIIIADIFLGGKGTGLDLLKAWENSGQTAPVLVTSGMPLQQLFHELGPQRVCPPFLQKPFDVTEAKRMIGVVLDYQKKERSA